MNEIRKNTETEQVLASAKCKMPKLIMALYIIAITFFSLETLIFLIAEIEYVNSDDYWNNYYGMGSYVALLVVSLIFLIIFIIAFVLNLKAIKKSKCVITNKRVYGTKAVFVARKDFSYRLDMIDNVEVLNSLGVNTLVISFSQGNGNQNVVQFGNLTTNMQNANNFIMKYIEKSDEFFDAVSKVLMSVKNDKDVNVDIEVKKIEAQAKQADAFAKIAENISTKQPNHTETKDDYISQLQRLKQLLDVGVITQQEFDEKKKALLK